MNEAELAVEKKRKRRLLGARAATEEARAERAERALLAEAEEAPDSIATQGEPNDDRQLWIDTRGVPVITTTPNGVRNAKRWGWTVAVAVPGAVVPDAAPDERKHLHAMCNCSPTLGPAHCHVCSDKAGSSVEWSECDAVTQIVADSVLEAVQAAEKLRDIHLSDAREFMSERDAATAALRLVKAIHQPFVRTFSHRELMYCKGCAVAGRGEKLWPCETFTAASGAPEPVKASTTCDECDEEAVAFWPKLTPPIQLCNSCEHNARRSGWEPGA